MSAQMTTPGNSDAYPFVGVLDLFRIGIGPSSSHTVGPMIAARLFLEQCRHDHMLEHGNRVTCKVFGSLALTGRGHATDTAIIAGLSGEQPHLVDPGAISSIKARITANGYVDVGGVRLMFEPARDLIFKKTFLPKHPNALLFTMTRNGQPVFERVYYSIGGGFVTTDEGPCGGAQQHTAPAIAFDSASELLRRASELDMSIAEVVMTNELAIRSRADIEQKMDAIWSTMRDCVSRGISATGVLPGGLGVERRARKLHDTLMARAHNAPNDPLMAMEWINLYALAVNEENAAGGRVVTAPTNGAAGIIPAVLHYFDRFVSTSSRDGIHRFLLAATAIGSIIKRNASISGADVGCQGEVGSAASMAAAGLTAALGGTNKQIENAAEIALEHNLGLTCDPVGGLVQIPCIERNAVASVKAVNAARLALHGNGTHRVSLDQAIETMHQTGKDMKRKYKETSKGGLAVNVPAC